MKKQIMVSMVLAAVCCALAESSPLEARIAEKYKILTSDTWGAGHRIIFDFNGRKGWVIEPATPAPGRPWVWTMQWMGAFLERTGAPDLVKRGYYHVHLAAYDTRANREGLLALADFQDYLVRELGFAPKANLIGMSWGGFFSLRYAETFPNRVCAIYLDAPVCNAADPEPSAADRVKTILDNCGISFEEMTTSKLNPLNNVEAIVDARIPLFAAVGQTDESVALAANFDLLEKRILELGGSIKVIRRNYWGHHPHGLDDPEELLAFHCAAREQA